MSARLAQAVNTHRFPPLFRRYPRLLAGLHVLMWVTTLRVWYVRRTLRRIFRAMPPRFTMLDVGFGAGDYLLPAAVRFPQATIIGVDKIEDNVEVCEGYVRAKGLRNVTLACDHVERFAPGVPLDLVACIGVLQLVEDDRGLLRHFFEGMNPGGTLVLYESIYHRRILPFYEPILNRYFEPYHVTQDRRHDYTPGEVRRKLEDAGFRVASVEYSFGPAGKLYYELYSLFMYVLLSAHWLWYPVLVPLFLLFAPFLVLLMGIDYMTPKASGNGMVVVARKDS